MEGEGLPSGNALSPVKRRQPMILRSCRLVVALVLAWGVTGTLPAQIGDTRNLFKEPKTPAEFFQRIQFEIDVGNYSIAAQYLAGLLKSNPSEKDLVDLE